jgi:phospholipid/cholesterol/gamma-HCH transport system permease protein
VIKTAKKEQLVLDNEWIIPVTGFLNNRKGRLLHEKIMGEWKKDVDTLVLDMENLNGMNSLGGAWIMRIKRHVHSKGMRFSCINAQSHVENYLRLIAPAIEHLSMKPPVPTGFFEGLGQAFFNAVKEARDVFRLMTDSIYWTFIAPVEGKRIRWASLFEELHEMGVRAVWIVVLINYLLGFIVAMLAAAQVRKFGAGIYVADLVGIGFARELAPIMTAIIVSARSGSAIASEIGTMKVQEELDALKVMGFHVADFLVAPKILAMLLAMPCLVILAMGAGVWGGLHVGIFILGLDARQWMQETISAVIIGDLLQGLIKSVVFAFVIVLVGCHNGLRVSGGARGVGLVTTRSVVMDIFFIIAFDVIFATLFYYTF